MDKRAIGIFDSGLGGLCAVREILAILPDEDIIYFGDSGRFPYGGRSYEIIKKYSRQNVNFLLRQNVKIILAACGTSSSVAINDLKKTFPDIPIIGVIEPACEKAVEAAKKTQNKNIGVIGTLATISTGSYKKCIGALDAGCTVYSKACPLFAPLVENGHIGGDPITKLAAERYLSEFKGLSSLILGCTHYPMIKDDIYEVTGTNLIDVGLEAAHKLKQELTARNMQNGAGKKGSLDIYISDEGLNFRNIASNFLGSGINCEFTQIDIEKY